MYRFDYRAYRRDFKTPLQTHHGIWKTREGIIIRLTDETGKTNYGEIAPLPLFGSETIEAALNYCASLSRYITSEILISIPEELVACQFAFESAFNNTSPDTSKLRYSYLLPSGTSVLDSWPVALSYPEVDTLKWKIGVYSPDEELAIWGELIQRLPLNLKIRLDANAGLNLETARRWLKAADESVRVEFIEQPLATNQLQEMLFLSRDYKTPIALDESVATLKQLEDCYHSGWQGVFVIKPCIMGFPSLFRKLCREYALDVVLSSVFETDIGRRSALGLVGLSKRSLGFGVNQWFASQESDWLDSLWESGVGSRESGERDEGLERCS